MWFLPLELTKLYGSCDISFDNAVTVFKLHCIAFAFVLLPLNSNMESKYKCQVGILPENTGIFFVLIANPSASAPNMLEFGARLSTCISF
jgi:hypothetical protein